MRLRRLAPLLLIPAAQAVLSHGFAAQVAALEARLLAGPTGTPRSDLPPLVAGFARRAGATGTARAAILTQSARLRLRQGGLFSAYATRQTVALGRPGFAWDARRAWGPLTWLRVLDAYVEGEGRLEARLLGAFPVARAGGPDAALGEALRYLAELPWFPDAILGNPSIRWRETGDHRVEAALDTPAGRAAVTFGFDAAGDIATMDSPARPSIGTDGTVARLDWRGRFSDYGIVGPRRLPRRGEVGYAYPSGFETYFEGEVRTCRLTG
ncbi:DUF6544 family protein [Rubellimicrobium aerolatum]|uniref:DUF6544 family protein n=1 Tax=Rubellimicrobium aerolatum TaxID=490979 RepID=A0ABW0SDD8_9RHOB|nr:DUF6544 family protein [Rubellimicrobium aerolatum]MBP1805756.1 hypothetical protein [Rubellimicrobium aerolatum]